MDHLWARENEDDSMATSLSSSLFLEVTVCEMFMMNVAKQLCAKWQTTKETQSENEKRKFSIANVFFLAQNKRKKNTTNNIQLFVRREMQSFVSLKIETFPFLLHLQPTLLWKGNFWLRWHG